MTDRERLLLLTYGPNALSMGRARQLPVGTAQAAGAPFAKTVGNTAIAATEFSAVKKMLPFEMRQRFSMSDESGARKVPETAKRSVAPFVAPGAVRSASWSQPVVRRIAFARPTAYDVDELLARCPSSETMAAIRRDFNISFDARLDAPWTCTTDGSESSTMLTVYNALRAMRLIEFDVPVPVLNTTNLYEWLYSLNLTNIHFTVGEAYSYADRGMLYLRGELFDSSELRLWVDPRSAIGLMNIVLLIVHEARHANAAGSHSANPDGTIGHVCSGDPSTENVHDPSIAYGGAWAAQYWAARWFAEHSGHYITSLEKRYAAGEAEQIRTSRFCNGGVE